MSRIKTTEFRDYVDLVQQTLLAYGWVQNSYGSCDRGFCVLGAADFVSVCFGEEYRIKLISKLHNIIPRIVPWNDRLGRTVDDVLSVLDKCKD